MLAAAAVVVAVEMNVAITEVVSVAIMIPFVDADILSDQGDARSGEEAAPQKHHHSDRLFHLLSLLAPDQSHEPCLNVSA